MKPTNFIKFLEYLLYFPENRGKIESNIDFDF